jgi:hypothetical protein
MSMLFRGKVGASSEAGGPRGGFHEGLARTQRGSAAGERNLSKGLEGA